MNIRVKAKYVNGSLKPAEAVPLTEGQEVIVSVEVPETAESEPQPADGSILEILNRLNAQYPPEIGEDPPKVTSINFRRYLYGGSEEPNP